MWLGRMVGSRNMVAGTGWLGTRWRGTGIGSCIVGGPLLSLFYLSWFCMILLSWYEVVVASCVKMGNWSCEVSRVVSRVVDQSLVGMTSI